MFTLAGKASFLGGTGTTLSYVTHSFDAAAGVISGTSWGGSITWSGGVAPYTVQLLSAGYLQYQATGISATTYTLRGAAINGWNGTSMQLKVIDSLGAVVVSANQAISVYWIGAVTVSVNSTTPANGTYSIITASIGSSNPASYSYQWYYRNRINSGALWGSWTAFAGNSNQVYSGLYSTTGQQWEFYCTVTNAAGSSTGYSPTVTVQA